jgi:hypothetical protein
MRHNLSNVLFILPAVVLLRLSAASDIPNGDFSSGLDQWNGEGTVVAQNNEALFRDQVPVSRLWTAYNFSGPGLFSFDFSSILSTNVPPAAGPDVFFVTLYFVNDLDTFDLLTGQFDEAQPLLDIDRAGPAPTVGVVESSVAKPSGWSLYSTFIDTAYRFVIPVFEFFNDNLATNDSEIRIDNVSLLSTKPRITNLTFLNNRTTLLIDFEHLTENPVAHRVERSSNLPDEQSWATVSATITEIGRASFTAELPVDLLPNWNFRIEFEEE